MMSTDEATRIVESSSLILRGERIDVHLYRTGRFQACLDTTAYGYGESVAEALEDLVNDVRRINEKFNKFLNYGFPKGDGITDDTHELQLEINRVQDTTSNTKDKILGNKPTRVIVDRYYE